MKTIIVTGGAGYIGSHTVVELLERGYNVVIADNLSNSSISVIDRITEITAKRPLFEEIDLCDREKTLRLFFRFSEIEAVIHFAAAKSVGESVEKPLHYYHNNLTSLINVLEAMRETDVSSIVFSSSCTVYGQPDDLPVRETSPLKPAESPYGKTKQISEQILIDAINAEKQIKGIALRYFNPIGSHPSALIGELPNGIPNNLVPFITQTAAGIRKKISIFGGDYNTADGTAIRDYIYVGDLALAHIVAIERLLNGENESPMEVFNLGTGKGNSVLEVVKAFEKVTGIKVNYEITNRRSGDIEQVWADTSVANEMLKWKADTQLETALQTAWRWEEGLRR